jgi:PHD/YefM family antitoxin component YafN of YafNO toxin-antitoxin module
MAEGIKMQIEKIISLDKFVANANELLDNLSSTHSPLILTKDDSAVAVIQNVHDYKKLLNALFMLKLMVQGEKEIQNGQGIGQDKVFAEIDRILESKVG